MLEVAAGDILKFDADVVAFKYSRKFRGADRAAARALSEHGLDIKSIQPPEREFAIVPTKGAMHAPFALFVGVPGVDQIRYSDIRLLASTVLRVLARQKPETEHLAMTIHGPGFGLDEVEALLSQLAGYVEAFQAGDAPRGLKRISIVDHRVERVAEIRQTLHDHQQEIPGASLLSHGINEWGLAIGLPHEHAVGTDGSLPGNDMSVRSDGLMDRTPDDQPHLFVALPFDPEMRDLFRYGIQGPARSAGFLCEHFSDTPFIGDVLDRIKETIKTSTAVIGVLTGDNPNVFLEVGYSWGIGRPTILVSKDGPVAPFDVRGERHVRYSSISDLEDKLGKELADLRKQGRI